MKRYICALTLFYFVLLFFINEFQLKNNNNVKKIVNIDSNIKAEVKAKKSSKYFSDNNIKEIYIVENYIKDTKYMDVYVVRLYKKRNFSNLGNKKKFYLYIKKNKNKLQIGDVVKIRGNFQEAQSNTNYGGFNIKKYNYSKGIYGTVKAEDCKKITHSKKFRYCIRNNVFEIREGIKKLYEKNLTKNGSALLSGLIVGDKSKIGDDIIDDFRKASLSHVLAISGAHFSYIILILNFINDKIKMKRAGYIFSIVSIIFFMELTGGTASVMRAGIMSVMIILGKLMFRKPDFWTNISLSLLIQMIANRYVIYDIGLQLSYLGVIGIVTLYDKVYKKIKMKVASVSISANLAILPIMIYNFNTISLSFVISNLMVTVLLGPIIIIGIVSIFFRIKPIFVVLNLLLFFLEKAANIGANLPFAQINVITPSVISLIIYYMLMYNVTIKNFLTKKIIAMLLIIIICSNLNYEVINANLKNELLINFVDVSQGDCTLVRYKGKNILIDGGGNESYNTGENILLPYLLDKKITSVDYLIFSHFDTDHCQGLLYLMDKIKIKNAVIGIQKEQYRNYQTFKKLSNKINVITMKQGDMIRIGDAKIISLWPRKDKMIGENSINNNSLVIKLEFDKFSILFTGDIEKVAENEIVNENLPLKSSILKVAHHGSKTSTTDEFLKRVSPKIALIGVGKNNKFKHPGDETIKKLNRQNVEIFRTDRNGEIFIRVKKYNKK